MAYARRVLNQDSCPWQALYKLMLSFRWQCLIQQFKSICPLQFIMRNQLWFLLMIFSHTTLLFLLLFQDVYFVFEFWQSDYDKFGHKLLSLPYEEFFELLGSTGIHLIKGGDFHLSFLSSFHFLLALSTSSSTSSSSFFFSFIFLGTDTHYVALAGLQLTM